MKRKIILLVTIITLMLNTVTMASGQVQTISVYFNSINLDVNGKQVYADNILYNGTTYIPLRKTAELLGCEVGWNGETNTASVIQYNEKKYIAFVFNSMFEITRISALCNDIYNISEFNFTKSHWNKTFHNSNNTYYQGLTEDIKYISEYYNTHVKYKDTMYAILSDITPKEKLDKMYLKLDEAYNKSAYIYSAVKNLMESSGYICTESEFITDIRSLFDIKEDLENFHADIYFDYIDYLYN